MTASQKGSMKQDESPLIKLITKLASEDKSHSLTFKELLNAQLGAQLSKQENRLLTSKISVSRFRLYNGNLKELFADRYHLGNILLQTYAKRSGFPAGNKELPAFFEILLHAQGMDVNAQTAKQHYQKTRAQLDSFLHTLNPEEASRALTQAGKTLVGLSTTLLAIKTAQAKTARSFSKIPKDFVLLLLPLYRQWVKKEGSDPKAKETFLNEVSIALIERQISTLRLPKEAQIKRIKVLRAYLKKSGVLEKLWLALKQANLSSISLPLTQSTLKQVEKIYTESETFYKSEFEPLQLRVKGAIHLCQRLSKLYVGNPTHARYLLQQALDIHSQYLACTKALANPVFSLDQLKVRLQKTDKNLNILLTEILAFSTSNYARKFSQKVRDFSSLARQKLWVEAFISLNVSPLRRAIDLAFLLKDASLADELAQQEARLLQSDSSSVNDFSQNVIDLFDHKTAIKTQFAKSQDSSNQSNSQTENQNKVEAAVFAPRIKT